MGARVEVYRDLPGPKGREFLAEMDEVAVTSVQNRLLILDSSKHWKGLGVRDVDMNWYLDFFCGAGVNNLGHAPEDVLQAVIRQITLGATCYDESVFPSPLALRLRRRLADMAPGEQDRKVFLSNSGTEAVEAALKILKSARPERTRFIAFNGAFHGRTLGSLTLNGSKEAHTKKFIRGSGVHHFPFPSYEGALDTLFEQSGTGALPVGEINAVFMELVQGEGGVNVADPVELKRLESWCRENDIKIVVDEVQTGVGRTGKFFACEHYDLNPDIITLAKALTNGAVPCGATIVNSDLDFDGPAQHANTFGGHYLSMVAAHAVLDRFEGDDSPLHNVFEVGSYLKGRLFEFSSAYNCIADMKDLPHMSKPRGLGLMIAVDFTDESTRDERNQPISGSSDVRERIVEECWRRGLILEGTGVDGIRFLPPLIVTKEQVDIAMRIFQDAVGAVLEVNTSYIWSGV